MDKVTGTTDGASASAGAGTDAQLTSMAEEVSTSLFGTAEPEPQPLPEPEPQRQPEPKAKTAEPEPQPQPQPAVKPAPKTWRPEAIAEWEKLPPTVQAEVLKREEDMFKGLEGYKAKASIGDAVQQVVAPYLEVITKAGLQPLPLIQNLLQAHTVLATGSAAQRFQLFHALAKEYGIDLTKQPDPDNPQVSNLQKEISEVKSKLSERDRSEQEAVRARLQSELETFASDPAHPYFDEVANDIAALLKSGVAKDLKDAYDRAVWANPVTRAKEQARQTAEADAKAKAERDKKAEEARRATSANVKVRPKAASATTPLGNIDDTLTETLAAIQGRA